MANQGQLPEHILTQVSPAYECAHSSHHKALWVAGPSLLLLKFRKVKRNSSQASGQDLCSFLATRSTQECPTCVLWSHYAQDTLYILSPPVIAVAAVLAEGVVVLLQMADRRIALSKDSRAQPQNC
jgi:hypothetical protein